MAVKAVQRTSLPGQVIAQVQELIARGEWPVGTKLPAEVRLAQDMGVGHSTLREALRAMAHFGVLEIKPGDGTYVRADNDLAASLFRRLSSDALEGLEVRNSLERDAARLATRRRTAEDLSQLRQHVDQQRQTQSAGDVEGCVEAVLAFHRALVAAAHNRVLDELYDNLTVVLRRIIGHAVLEGQQEQARLDEAHDDLLAAVQQQDEEAADRAITAHLAHVEDLVRQGVS